MTHYWTRVDTQLWISQLENRIEDIEYYLKRTVEWCENNGVWDDKKVFMLAFVTVLWVCHMRGEEISRKEIFELIGIDDWEMIEQDELVEIGPQLANLDWEEVLTKVNNAFPF